MLASPRVGMGDGGTGSHVQNFTDAFTPGFALTRSLAYARARLELPRRKAGEGTQLTRPFEAAQVAQLHAHGYGSDETHPVNTLGQCDVLAERFSLRDLLVHFGFSGAIHMPTPIHKRKRSKKKTLRRLRDCSAFPHKTIIQGGTTKQSTANNSSRLKDGERL